ncbi:YdiU family protein [Pseudoruegeria sp. HB172150]|uniref:protein adenylyltransferase SelO n=1 Tax=Pseudoruegeria sp. HB172150 TaxID=2721164 RepID=UPI00155752E7|nr:YdiU family protein [Pseudoruegeria sp. HB172150]
MTLHVPFDNSYGKLPDRFFTRVAPTPVAEPSLIALNAALAKELGLDAEALRSNEGVAALAGNAVPDGADPLAQVYAGHQFGGWNPQLGDGRAILLGEVIDSKGVRRDLQLKGSGPTPYSRRGDGRAWLGPVLREYVVSEAMHALGIPTTRALAAVATGEPVIRERQLPGAVLTRVASSHIRVGTFQYFAARNDIDAIRKLMDYVIERHYPGIDGPLGMLDALVERQAHLVAQWMGVGFIHGVMNTDNTHVAGETIDYGPCAFMDAYHPGKVFSSIDHMGRYAYGRQPEIAIWNLAQLATALLPVIDEDTNIAVDKATEVVNRFPDLYAAAWLRVFRGKLGLSGEEEADANLIARLLTHMAEAGMDFTNSFRALTDDADGFLSTNPVLAEWAAEWSARLDRDGADPATQKALMRRANPAVIPRNHRVEEMISAAVEGNYAPFFKLNDVLYRPFDLAPDNSDFAAPPRPEQEVRRTFCGT